jgi:hypothetical protein
MNKTLTTSLTAIALAGGGIIGVGSLAAASYGDEPPTLDDATVEDDSDPVGLQDATDDTEDTVDTTDEATADEESDHHGRRGGCGDSEAVAEALGMTSDELQAARDGGQSLAEIAADQNVSVDAVVDALVDGVEAHLAEEVAEGDLTQEEADERLASAEERATERVEATPGEDGARGFRGGRGDRNGAPADADIDGDASADDDA